MMDQRLLFKTIWHEIIYNLIFQGFKICTLDAVLDFTFAKYNNIIINGDRKDYKTFSYLYVLYNGCLIVHPHSLDSALWNLNNVVV